jgi:Nif-specific ferredoxin III
MPEMIVGSTRGGVAWTPGFLNALDQHKGIGCGRCDKVCPREVFERVDRDHVEGLEALEEDWDDDEEDGFSDDTGMVMSLKNLLDCIGCQACSKVCLKKALSHEPAPAAA